MPRRGKPRGWIDIHVGPFDIELDASGAKDVYLIFEACGECGRREIIAEFRRKDHAVKWAKEQLDGIRLSQRADASLADDVVAISNALAEEDSRDAANQKENS